MKTFAAIFLALIILISCGDKANKTGETTLTPVDSTAAADPSSTSIDTSDYLPIASVLEGEISSVENSGAGILKKSRNGHKKDSVYIQYKDFKSLAGQFLLKELGSDYFRNNFTETSLADETTGMLNFLYTPRDSLSQLRRAIVYITPTLTSNKIDRIYMETLSAKDGVQIEKRLTWKMGQYFYIITSRQARTGDPETTIEKLIWDPQHYADN